MSLRFGTARHDKSFVLIKQRRSKSNPGRTQIFLVRRGAARLINAPNETALPSRRTNLRVLTRFIFAIPCKKFKLFERHIDYVVPLEHCITDYSSFVDKENCLNQEYY